MSVKNGKVCCNCRHCIRSKDKKYDIIICKCDIYKMYLSYAEIMCGCCKQWSKGKGANNER